MSETDHTLRGVSRAWLPLAASWALMAIELPAVSAVVARLPDSQVHLAAYGGVVFPIALIVEAPVIMLLATSTALSKDRESHRALATFAHRMGAALSALHALLAFTPAFDLIIVPALEVPPEVVEPARLGLRLMLPWTWCIAWRRFNQGVMIRFGRSREVGFGTTVRLLTLASTLALGYAWWHFAPDKALGGSAVAASAVSAGILAEALFSAVCVRSTVRRHLMLDDPAEKTLRGRAFASFYVPLALTSLITLIVQPIATGAIGRMPNPIDSLAVWPVVIGLLFFLQALGLAFNEVIVARIGDVKARPALWRFTLILAGSTGAAMCVVAFSPLGQAYMADLSNLDPALASLGATSLALALPIPVVRAMQSWYQGLLVHVRYTRPITESVALFLVVCSATLAVGLHTEHWPGLHVAIAGYSLGRIAQLIWVWWRARGRLT